MASSGGIRAIGRVASAGRVVAAVLTVAAVTIANVVVEGWWWARLLIGLLGGIAVATELVLPRRVHGWSNDAETFWQQVAAEIERARRHERPLLLVRWPLDDATDRDDLQSQLRRHDIACRVGEHAHLLLPELAADGAIPVLRRLGVPVGAGAVEVAEFPRNGLTVDGLIDGLRPFPFDGHGPQRSQLAS